MDADRRNPRSQLPNRRRRPLLPPAVTPTPRIPPDPSSQPLAVPVDADATAPRNTIDSKPGPVPPPPPLSADDLCPSFSSALTISTAAPRRDAVGGEMSCVDDEAGSGGVRVEVGGERNRLEIVSSVNFISRCGISIDNSTSRWSKIGPTEEIIEYLICVFVVTGPTDDLMTFVRVIDRIEEAYWFYEDYFVDRFQHLKSFELRDFTELIFKNCECLTPFMAHFDALYNNFQQYNSHITVCGAILLNPSYTKCLLVQGWGCRRWGFPRGKRAFNEKDHDTAIREVSEEVGYDISEKLIMCHSIVDVYRGKKIRLFIIPDVNEETMFTTRTRKEIGAIEWHQIDDMDKMDIFRKDVILCKIRKWIAENPPCEAHNPPKDYPDHLVANMPSPTLLHELSLSPQMVANAFVEKYYTTLLSSPESVHKFYKESSSLTRPDTDGVLAPVTTVHGQQAIDNMVMSLGYYKNCAVEILTKDALLTQDDGVLILISGYLINQDKNRRKFSQSFVLCREGSGVYFVLNDMVEFVSESLPKEVNIT